MVQLLQKLQELVKYELAVNEIRKALREGVNTFEVPNIAVRVGILATQIPTAVYSGYQAYHGNTKQALAALAIIGVAEAAKYVMNKYSQSLDSIFSSADNMH